MKKIIFQFSVSLDGYFEGPNRELDWHMVDGEFNAYVVEMLEAADVLVMGRVNYELMASYWPTAPNDDDVKKFMNSKPKLVFSRTLKDVPWQNSRLAAGSISEEVARLKQQPGDGFLWVGGSKLASQFLDLGLIDEVRLIQTPVFLGGGHTLFSGIKARHRMKHVSTRPFESGNVLLTYRPVRD
jgi:dihydrofolate reductase